MESESTIEGTVQRVIFVNEENNFTVARLLLSDGLSEATIVGNLAAVTLGESLRCSGR